MSELPVALLCTSNGVGLGHLTRQMAVARALKGRMRPVIFTLSGAVAVPVAEGFAVEHLPSAGHAGIPTTGWHDLLGDRLDHLIRTLRPAVVTFDGVHPYAGFVAALSSHRRSVVRVWQRRAMWRRGVGAEALATSDAFDLVIEPGEYAAPYDEGVTTTAGDQNRVMRVAPVVYAPERLDRDDACRELGLDPEAKNLLVQLGAGALNDVTTLTGAVVAALDAAATRDETTPTVVVGRSVLSSGPSGTAGSLPPVPGSDPRIPLDSIDPTGSLRVLEARRFPWTRSLAAFDAAILAAGYNSFHEALAAGLPSVFVPNLATRTDDQDARARFAQDQGLGWRWDGADPAALDAVLAEMLDPARRAAMVGALGALAPARGAVEIADHLVEALR